MVPLPNKAYSYTLAWLGSIFVIMVAVRFAYIKGPRLVLPGEPAPSAQPASVPQSSHQLTSTAPETVAPEVEDSRPLLDDHAQEQHQAELKANLQALTPAQAPSAYQSLIMAPANGFSRYADLFAMERRWGMINPLAALQYLDTLSAIERRDGYDNVLQGWAEQNPGQARVWLAAHPSHPQYAAAFSGFIFGRALTSPLEALKVVLNTLTPDDRLLPNAMLRLADAAFSASLVELRNWYQSVPAIYRNSTAYKAEAAGAIYALLLTNDLGAVFGPRPWPRNPRAARGMADDR